MSLEIYLQLDGVRGEVTEPLHEGWIEVFSFSLANGRPLARTAKLHDLYCTCTFDRSAPVLGRMSANGTPIPNGKLHVFDDKGNVRLKLTFTNVVVASQSNAPTGDGGMVQTIQLNFDKFEADYGNPAALPTSEGWGDATRWDLAAVKKGT
jgi:type VI secretion system secreted protein Hcp